MRNKTVNVVLGVWLGVSVGACSGGQGLVGPTTVAPLSYNLSNSGVSSTRDIKTPETGYYGSIFVGIDEATRRAADDRHEPGFSCPVGTIPVFGVPEVTCELFVPKVCPAGLALIPGPDGGSCEVWEQKICPAETQLIPGPNGGVCE